MPTHSKSPQFKAKFLWTPLRRRTRNQPPSCREAAARSAAVSKAFTVSDVFIPKTGLRSNDLLPFSPSNGRQRVSTKWPRWQASWLDF